MENRVKDYIGNTAYESLRYRTEDKQASINRTHAHGESDIAVLGEPCVVAMKVVATRQSTHGISGEDTMARREARVERVAAYCRVSTGKEEQADSYAVQRESYEKMFEDIPDMVLVGVYGDKGVSGKSARRPDFQRMMEDCAKGKIDTIICKSISRFSRNLTDSLDYVRMLKRMGVRVVFEREGINTMDKQSELILSILASVAQEEVNSLSKNMLWAREKANACGNPFVGARYGYRIEKQPDGFRKWVVDEQAARRIRFIYESAADKTPYREILSGLAAIEQAAGSGDRWSLSRVKDVIKSEVYVGDILTGKYYVPDYLQGRRVRNTGQRSQYYIENHHEAIVSRELRNLALKNCKIGVLRSFARGEERKDV